MPSIKYTGRASDGVTLETLDGPVHVGQGDSVDVSDDVAKSLLKTSQWSKGAKSNSPTPTTKD